MCRYGGESCCEIELEKIPARHAVYRFSFVRKHARLGVQVMLCSWAIIVELDTCLVFIFWYSTPQASREHLFGPCHLSRFEMFRWRDGDVCSHRFKDRDPSLHGDVLYSCLGMREEFPLILCASDL